MIISATYKRDYDLVPICKRNWRWWSTKFIPSFFVSPSLANDIVRQSQVQVSSYNMSTSYKVGQWCTELER